MEASLSTTPAIIDETGAAAATSAGASLEAQSGAEKSGNSGESAGARMIRVNAEKLDLLIDQVGEMVIAAASSNLVAQRGGQAEMMESTSVLARLVENIRDSALQLRMVRIGETFNPYQWIVAEAAQELNKEVELVINGADTELDKSVAEKLDEPLQHLIRNAIGHGIETVEVRSAAGKPKEGKLILNAYHDSGSIVIEVSDDGGGLPLEAIRSKALERGLIEANAVLSDQDIARLIFEPDFMAPARAGDEAERSIGMDVVSKNITALRGTVEVETQAGRGSTFSIRLPLTLAIIDGFLVAVNDASYVIPLDNVVECLELGASATRGNMLNLRGEVLPFIRLRDFFEVDAPPPQRENVVVVHASGRKAGIVVDQLLGEFQTVIKPLGNLFRHLHGIGGSTILGSGEVALILDVPAMTQLAASHQHQEEKPGQAPHSSHPTAALESR